MDFNIPVTQMHVVHNDQFFVYSSADISQNSILIYFKEQILYCIPA